MMLLLIDLQGLFWTCDLQSADVGSDKRFGQSLSGRPRSENILPGGGATIRPFVRIISQQTLAPPTLTSHTHTSVQV